MCCWAAPATLLAVGGGAGLRAVAKGWLIGERFMELAHAPALWRRLLLAWPLLMALAVGAALCLARMNN